jgi:hypothetical protein
LRSRAEAQDRAARALEQLVFRFDALISLLEQHHEEEVELRTKESVWRAGK